MRLAGKLKLYLLGPELDIEHLTEDVKLVDVHQFIIDGDLPEDLKEELKLCEKAKQKEQKEKKEMTRWRKDKEKREYNLRTFQQFFDDCLVKDEKSYAMLDDIYDCYKIWVESKGIEDNINKHMIARMLKCSKSFKHYNPNSIKSQPGVQLGVSFKDKSMAKRARHFGEVYSFLKTTFKKCKDAPRAIDIRDAYVDFKKWCEIRDIQVLSMQPFSRVAANFFPDSAMFYEGNPAKFRHRTIRGYTYTPFTEAA